MLKKTNNNGFTLIELIVVMAVIGVLVLLAIPKLTGHTEKARLVQFKSDMKQLENASERYYIDKQEWPKLSNNAYTKDQIEIFSQEVKDKMGQVITLDPDGKYYDIDYTKLQKYVQKPKNSVNYIIQNPIGEIYFLDKLTEEGANRLLEKETNTPKIPINNKPIAVISMSPEQNLTTITNIVWSHVNSNDPDGDEIINAEWELNNIPKTNPNGMLPQGSYIMRLRVQDSKGEWSNWVSKIFTINVDYGPIGVNLARSFGNYSSNYGQQLLSLGFDGQYTLLDVYDDAIRYNEVVRNDYWLQCSFNTGYAVNSINIVSYYTRGYEPIKNFRFVASNSSDFSTYDVLYSGVHPDAARVATYDFPNDTAYKYYRLYVDTLHPGNGGSNLIIKELEFYRK